MRNRGKSKTCARRVLKVRASQQALKARAHCARHGMFGRSTRFAMSSARRVSGPTEKALGRFRPIQEVDKPDWRVGAKRRVLQDADTLTFPVAGDNHLLGMDIARFERIDLERIE